MTRAARILVADDDSEVRAVTRLALEQAGYAVAEAADGLDALAQVHGGDSFDLVLLDINMPRMNGWETLRALQADPRTALLPVAMFSIKGQVRDRVHGLQDGAIDYIVKPFGLDDLVARVERLLAAAGPR